MSLFNGKDKEKLKEYKELIDNYKKQISDLEQSLYYDTLTKCKNKKSFKKDMEIYENKAKYVVVAISVDLDKVNKKNRENGDAILFYIAKDLMARFPNVYHICGTKFNILINLCDFKEELIEKWYEETLTKYPDINLFYGIAKSTDGIGLRYFDITQIAIKKMFSDIHFKKPENKDLELELEEKRRLEEVKKQNEALEEETYQANIQNSMDKMRAIFERRQKEKILWENKKKYESNVFELPEEAGSDMEETEEQKNLCTMWFNKETLSFVSEGVFYEYDFYIFPLTFVKPPAALPIVCVIDNKKQYRGLSGDIIHTGIAKKKISVSAHFDDDGNLISNISFDDLTVEFDKKTSANKPVYMPKNYGKKFFDELLFPIKPNVNGSYDMAVYKEGDSEVEICAGNRIHDNEKYTFIVDSKAIYVRH